MTKKHLKIIIMILFLFLVSGCTKSFKDNGKLYTENILCKPNKKETIEIYERNNIDISHLKPCSEYGIKDGGYEGLINTFFVKPLAIVLLKVGQILNSYGFAIIIVTILLRMLVVPITTKSMAQSENMKKAQPEIDKLNKKYENKTDRESLMMKSQEQLLIYKKYDIKPLSGCIFLFIQIPLFFAFFEAINRLPVLFEENFLNLFELRRTPMEAIKLNQFYYLIIVGLIIITTYFSFKINKTMSTSTEQEEQMKMVSNIMIIMISIFSFNLSVGIGLYWIFNSGFTIFQNMVMKGSKKSVRN